MSCTRKWNHICSELRNENGSRASRDARNRHEKREAFLKGSQTCCYFLLQQSNTLLEKIELGERLREQKPMMGFHLPLQSLLQEGDLRAHPTAGQFGQFKRIGVSSNEGFKHQPGAFPQHIAHH